MPEMDDNLPLLPGTEEIRQAVSVYLRHAYPGGAPASTSRFLPPPGQPLGPWLMADLTERDPADAPLAQVRSFAMRIGNEHYPHMKLRLSRPPNEREFVFSVDSHDAILSAPAGSPDSEALEELKRGNARIASAVHGAWDAAGLLTERNYLRRKIRQAREKASPPADPPGEDA